MTWDDRDEPDGEWEECFDCEGMGHIHDCGEDCCCCADPDGPDDEERLPCSTCEGRGGVAGAVDAAERRWR